MTAEYDSNGNGSSVKFVVELGQRCALDVKVDVSVYVHGHLDGAVADDLHDYSRLDAECEEQTYA